MGNHNGGTPASGSSSLSVLAGAVIGVAGLAWWLLAEAERAVGAGTEAERRRHQGRPSRTAGIAASPAIAATDRDLHDRVHELNQAIDDVRRQLESMTIQG
jgi:hypothetical protein